MNRDSTLVSYLEKLRVVLTGNIGNPAASTIPVHDGPLVNPGRARRGSVRRAARWPARASSAGSCRAT